MGIKSICCLSNKISLIFSDNSYEKIDFLSANPFSMRDVIVDLDNQESQTVHGILRFPQDIHKESYPLIIGVAGSLGWGSHHYEFLEMYREMGIATFELNSFKSRGIESTVGTQIEVTVAAMILDSYKALDTLAKHPKIDKDKIAITGWSLGGGVSLFSGWLPIKEAINPDNDFVAHLPFYPPCFVKPENLSFVDSPIHILIGELDDWTPADACQDLVLAAKKVKDNIDITIYEKSHHSFDSNLDERVVENGYSFKDCMFTVRSDGAVLMNYLNIFNYFMSLLCSRSQFGCGMRVS